MNQDCACAPFKLIYQVFPDRFAQGLTPAPEDKQRLGLYPEGSVVRPWGEPPAEGVPAASQHYGGDLFGLAERAGYLADLGVDAVYLTPIHPAPSYHRYDAIDQRAVAESLGGIPGFEAMLAAVHRVGIRVILDLVLNHVSNRHPWFLEAQADPASPRRDCFRFHGDGGYDCWRGHRTLPELNLEQPAVLEELITGEDSVLRCWIRRGVDAIRLDCANDLGVAVCRLARETARACRAEVQVIGETFHFGADWLRGLDGLQSYVLTFSIFDLLSGRIDGRQFGMNLTSLDQGAKPWGGLDRCWTMLSSHDIPRALSTLEGDLDRLELALLLQFTLPGSPMIYYGDENGMAGGADPFNRMPMIWDQDRWNGGIRALYRRMIALRADRPELQGGDFHDLSQWSANGTVGFLRTSPGDPREFCLVFVNPTSEPRRFPVYVPAGRMFADMVMRDLLSGRTVTTGSGSLEIDLQPRSGAVYVPEYRIPQYDFAKRL